MAVAMPKLERDPKSGRWRSRKVIPMDLRPVFGKGEEKPSWPASLSETEARAAYGLWLSDLETKIAVARQGFTSLSAADIKALAARWFREEKRALESQADAPEAFEAVLTVLREGERSHVYDHIRNKANELLRRAGLNADEDSRKRLTQELHHLHVALYSHELRRAKGDYSPDPTEAELPPPEAQTFADAKPPSFSAPRLMQLFDKWAAHPEQRGNAPNTIKRFRGVFKVLARELGNPLASSVTSDQVAAYLESRMTAKEHPISPRTARDVHKAALSSVFNWAKGKRIVNHNPAKDCRVKVVRPQRERDPGFEDEEAAKILAAATVVAPSNRQQFLAASKRWVPFLLAYTGARVQEITQLRKGDVHQHRTGFWFLRLTPEAGTIKSRDARDVPLHPRLEALGFIGFVRSSNDGPLFYDPAQRRKPNAASTQAESRAGDLSQWVRKTVGIDDPNIGPNHAWRHRFKTVCRNAGVAEQYADAITGHAPASQGRAYGNIPVETLYREICKLTPEAVEGATAAMRPANESEP